jgi:hypothetical protein
MFMNDLFMMAFVHPSGAAVENITAESGDVSCRRFANSSEASNSAPTWPLNLALQQAVGLNRGRDGSLTGMENKPAWPNIPGGLPGTN